MENIQEIQYSIDEYIVTLLSDEIIEIKCLIEDNVYEDRDGDISIDLKIAACDQRLYQAFTNKELIKCIMKKLTNASITDTSKINHTFTYNQYFKIQNFISSCDSDGLSNYSIGLKTI